MLLWIVTLTYGTKTYDVAYNANTATYFTFVPSLTTALIATDTKVTITYAGKTVNQAITVTPIAAITTDLTGVAITGTPELFQTLTAVPTPSTATASYQWLNNGVDISGATGSTYILAATDINDPISVKATGTGDYTGSETSSATIPVEEAIVTSVAISGTPQYLQTLTATTVPADATVTYQWQVNNVNVSTASTYTVAATDVGQPITVIVTATINSNFQGSKTSTPVTGLAKVIDIAVITGVTSPVGLDTFNDADLTVDATAQYTAVSTWFYGTTPLIENKFLSGYVYNAHITITAKPGYTVIGVPANFVTIANATSTGNAAPVVPATTIEVIAYFSPAQ